MDGSNQNHARMVSINGRSDVMKATNRNNRERLPGISDNSNAAAVGMKRMKERMLFN